MKRKEIPTGTRFGKLVVIGDGDKLSNGNRRLLCRCDCGVEKLITVANLRWHTKSCGCSTSYFNSLAHKGKRTKPGTAKRRRLYYAKKSASQRKINWELTDEQFYSLSKQCCGYSGRTPKTVQRVHSGDSYVYNGIDRIDNSKPYILDNVVSCDEQINRMKLDYTFEEFLIAVKEIYEYLRLNQGLPQDLSRPLIKNG